MNTQAIDPRDLPASAGGARVHARDRFDERGSRIVSRLTTIIYVVIALATPFLLYEGPDVMTPAALAIAEAAHDGHLSIHRQVAGDAVPPAIQPSAAVR